MCLCYARRPPPRSPARIRVNRLHIRASLIRRIPCGIIGRNTMRWTPRERRFSQFAICSRSRPVLWWRLILQPRPPLRSHPHILRPHPRRKRNRAARSRATLVASQRRKLPRPSVSPRSSRRWRAADITRAIQTGSGTPTQLRQCRNSSPPMASTPAAN